MYLQHEVYLIENYSVDINIAMDICVSSLLLIDSKYFGSVWTLMAMYIVIYDISRT